MDALPAIIVEPEGWDTWARLVQSMDKYNVTVVTLDGTTVKGCIADILYDGDELSDTLLVLGAVDDDWEPVSGFVQIVVDQITGIVVH